LRKRNKIRHRVIAAERQTNDVLLEEAGRRVVIEQHTESDATNTDFHRIFRNSNLQKIRFSVNREI
jgi:hypothetical protein